ncbi:hypothetical protein K490DRAFT_53556 [Saccharata proteae CBS 121410]|uniref:Uncharacterized protein n=1 Tax=Saccharata proteae CBS 121410 TaxID=1314787 RepID=A0A9P4I2B1_9PEZI|nr:hypothetical protein K490DRAFT_53556 [Saccharata proteae CBS 121410]
MFLAIFSALWRLSISFLPQLHLFYTDGCWNCRSEGRRSTGYPSPSYLFGRNADNNEMLSVFCDSIERDIEYPAGNDGICYEMKLETGKASDCFLAEICDGNPVFIAIDQLQAKENPLSLSWHAPCPRLLSDGYGVKSDAQEICNVDVEHLQGFVDKDADGPHHH